MTTNGSWSSPSGSKVPRSWDEAGSRASASSRPRVLRAGRVLAATLLVIGILVVYIAVRALGWADRLTPAWDVIRLRSSRIAFAGGTTGGPQIFSMLGDGSQRVALTSTGPASPSSPYPAWEPAWSPDGRLLAFRGFWGDGKFSDLFVMNADGTEVRQLTTHMNGSDPTWSPDGSRIAFAGYDGVYTINSDGSGLRAISTGDADYSGPSWSLDEQRIAFSRLVGDLPQIFVANVDGSSEQQLTRLPNGGAEPAWSPDGLHIVFQGDVMTIPSLFSMDPTGGSLMPVTRCNPPSCTGDSYPIWLPDGDGIGFVRDRNIFTVRSDGTNLRQVTSDAAGYIRPGWRPATGG